MSLGTEDLIQISILEWLRLVRPDAIAFHVPNGAHMSPPTARRMKRLGMLAGVPDLIVLFPGWPAAFFEVKAPHGILSDAQKCFSDAAKAMGQPLFVVRSIDDMRTALEALGVEVWERTA